MSHPTPWQRNDGATEVGRTDGSATGRPAYGTDERYAEGRSVEDRIDTSTPHEDQARQRFGGTNVGACFFGWLVAVAVAILLTSVIGAVVAALGSSTSVTQSEAERRAGDIGLAAAVILLVVLAVGYYLGGYVAGRMSRFDGGRQGFGVWLIGLVVTVLAIALGAVFGSQYDVLNRVSLPNLPISTDQLGWGAVITAAAVIVITLLAAVLGGKAGHRYHDRVDDAAWKH